MAFLSYCLQVTLQRWLSGVASGLTPRSVLEQLATLQLVDVHLPTTEPGKEIVLRRRTVPEKAVELILHQLENNVAVPCFPLFRAFFAPFLTAFERAEGPRVPQNDGIRESKAPFPRRGEKQILVSHSTHVPTDSVHKSE